MKNISLYVSKKYISKLQFDRLLPKGIILLLLILVIVLGYFDLFWHGFHKSVDLAVINQEKAVYPAMTNHKTIINPTKAASKLTPVAGPPPLVSVSGSITPLGDLQLFSVPYLKHYLSGNYYDAGTFDSGPYAGYKRIIAITQPYGEDQVCSSVEFATKDNKTYVVDSEERGPMSNDNPNSILLWDLNKIKYQDQLGSDFPESISLPMGYKLVQGDYYSISDTTDESDCRLATDFSSYHKLAQGNKLTYYALPDSTEFPSEVHDGTEGYRYGAADILAVDKTGVGYVYMLANPSIFTDGSFLSLDTSSIKMNAPHYNSYGQEVSFVAKNISDSDLKKIGTSQNGQSIYTLKDPQHPLYQNLFTEYIQGEVLKDYQAYSGGASGDYWKSVPKTESDFAAKNPVIFIKDPWGRYIALEQSDFELALGGGKPVLYFYPSKDTKVSIIFQKQMQFFSTAPSYNNGWFILAHPDGTLNDLTSNPQPCDDVNTNEFGLEYAKEACLQNVYPYLYWSGVPQGEHFPIPKQGWDIPKENLVSFLHKSLSKLGLNQKEQNDMVSYWKVRMTETGAPYYRVSFLQTSELNAFVPMNISPKPDTYLRVFMVWFPLYKKPTEEPTQQTLTPVNRKGFTVVEWGGLKYD